MVVYGRCDASHLENAMKRRKKASPARVARGDDANPLWIINVAMAVFFVVAALLLSFG
jgi:hypothetical protein